MPRSRSRSRTPPRPARDLGPEVEAFLRAEPELEERAAVMLRSKGAEVQRLVLARGGLSATRNPTAVLISRIRNAEEGLRPVLETERAPEEIERFLIIERVEPHAAARLRRAPRVVQQAVVSRGSLAGTRDPTAVLMTRIRDAEKEHAPSSDPLVAIQQAAQAAQDAADPYGSDPQAYALAYYAQMQAAYPQSVQGYAPAGYAGYPTVQMAASYPTAGQEMAVAAAPAGTQVVQVQGMNGMQAIQLPPGYQLYPVGVANADGSIGALPAGFNASAMNLTQLCGATATAVEPSKAGEVHAVATMQGSAQAMSMAFPGGFPTASYPSMPSAGYQLPAGFHGMSVHGGAMTMPAMPQGMVMPGMPQAPAGLPPGFTMPGMPQAMPGMPGMPGMPAMPGYQAGFPAGATLALPPMPPPGHASNGQS